HRDSPPAQCVLAVLARADDSDLALSALRAVASRRPDLRPLLRQPRWSRLVAASQTHRQTAPDLVPIARSLTRALTVALTSRRAATRQREGGARPRTEYGSGAGTPACRRPRHVEGAGQTRTDSCRGLGLAASPARAPRRDATRACPAHRRPRPRCGVDCERGH